MELLLKLLIDVLALIPGLSELKQGEQVAVDAVTVGESLYAWSQTAEGQKVIGDAETLIKGVGGSITKDETGAVVGYTIPPVGSYAGAHGGSMWMGPGAIKVGE